MGKYNELISDRSVWLSATPTETALALPFHITEAGHFWAQSGYRVSRDYHESFLLILTVSGSGCVKTNEAEVELGEGCACIINCRSAHEYFCTGSWEFYWIHFDGASVAAMLKLLYPNGSSAVDITCCTGFYDTVSQIVSEIELTDIESCFKMSNRVHLMVTKLISAVIRGGAVHGSGSEIGEVIEYIHKNYKEQISVDDMTAEIHMSKFHFIRMFRRVMGVTPYSYLTNYRINKSKELLRSTSMSISDIAGECGFLDPGNFIVQFKKRTSLRPLQYRRDFSP